MELQWAATDGLVIFASGSALSTEYKDFIESSGVDSTGNKLQRTPENQFGIGFDWPLVIDRFPNHVEYTA